MARFVLQPGRAWQLPRQTGLSVVAVQPEPHRDVDASIRRALAAELAELGCPSETAAEIAESARVEWRDSIMERGVWLLMVRTPASDQGVEYPYLDDTNFGVEHLAQRIADDNAEACDRQRRGEPGWSPYWPLPARDPRRS